MLSLKIGDKELKVKFGYTPTLKERLISKFIGFSTVLGAEENLDLEKIEDLLLYLPEILLIGLQVYHEEYRYDYDTKKGKDEQLQKVFELVDEYALQDGADTMQLFYDLQEEMMTDGFLRSLFQKEQKKTETLETATQKADSKQS